MFKGNHTDVKTVREYYKGLGNLNDQYKVNNIFGASPYKDVNRDEVSKGVISILNRVTEMEVAGGKFWDVDKNIDTVVTNKAYYGSALEPEILKKLETTLYGLRQRIQDLNDAARPAYTKAEYLIRSWASGTGTWTEAQSSGEGSFTKQALNPFADLCTFLHVINATYPKFQIPTYSSGAFNASELFNKTKLFFKVCEASIIISGNSDDEKAVEILHSFGNMTMAIDNVRQLLRKNIPENTNETGRVEYLNIKIQDIGDLVKTFDETMAKFKNLNGACAVNDALLNTEIPRERPPKPEIPLVVPEPPVAPPKSGSGGMGLKTKLALGAAALAAGVVAISAVGGTGSKSTRTRSRTPRGANSARKSPGTGLARSPGRAFGKSRKSRKASGPRKSRRASGPRKSRKSRKSRRALGSRKSRKASGRRRN